MAKLKITQTNSVTGEVHDKYVTPTVIGTHIGGTGGLTSQAGYQIQPQVYVTGGSSQAGSILAQKGAHKFRVTDGTLKGDCTLVNSPNLVAGQMNILINLTNIVGATTANASANAGATSTYVTWSSNNVTGVLSTPRVGDYIIGFSGAAAVARVTAVNSATNVTIAVTGNVTSTTANVTESTYASRITNKYVYDFTSDGQQDSTTGTVTYYTSGYNPTKWRYRLSAANSTFVQVQSA